ncbi:hypothetical protein D3C81_1377020 [compost metagenome]
MHVAGRDRRPGVDDGDHRLVEVGVLHACRAQIGARRGPGRALGDGGTARIGLFFAVGRVGHRIFRRFYLLGRVGHIKNPAAGRERGEAGDFDGVRSGRRHPHRSAKRNKNYRKKEYAQRQHAKIGRRFRGAQDRSNGGAVGHGRTFQLGALMPLSMLRRNPLRSECGRKMRRWSFWLVLRASDPWWARADATFHRFRSRHPYVRLGRRRECGWRGVLSGTRVR